jgi:hypothetical protein
VDVFVAPDAQPHELRCALALALKLPDSAPLRLYRRVDGGRLVPCALSAGVLLCDVARPLLLLDAGAPPAPGWWWQHAAQLCGLACFAGLASLPHSTGWLCLMPLALAAAARAPGPARLLPRAASTFATFVTAYVFFVVDAAAVPPLLALLGCIFSGAAALFRARVLLLGILLMLAQMLLGRVAALEARMRVGGKSAAKPGACRTAVRLHTGG